MAYAILNKKDDDSIISDLGYTKQMLLNYNEVKVLYFNKTSKTIVNVTPLPIDQEGFTMDTIDSTINNQNVAAEILYAHLLEVQ